LRHRALAAAARADLYPLIVYVISRVLVKVSASRLLADLGISLFRAAAGLAIGG
jgi:hypothetical protein